jgi:hypothetical protein
MLRTSNVVLPFFCGIIDGRVDIPAQTLVPGVSHDSDNLRENITASNTAQMAAKGILLREVLSYEGLIDDNGNKASRPRRAQNIRNESRKQLGSGW